LRDLFARQREYASADGEDFLDAAQNARLVANAEAYYRAMYHGAAASWNLRDEHMFDTLDLLMRSKGAGAKTVVWAHNSHIGDARFTDMGESRDELNLGQLTPIMCPAFDEVVSPDVPRIFRPKPGAGTVVEP